MPVVIERPQTTYDDPSHTYTLNGEELLGISTIAKVGGVEDTWGIASAWGFRIGYEGSYDLYVEEILQQCDTKDELRACLKSAGLTPWSKRDKAAERGNWVHDALESLAQNGNLPDLGSYSDEIQGHMCAILQWYIDYRPEFVAAEVQVTSVRHGFAGRYDIRCKIYARNVLRCFRDQRSHQHREFQRLGLIDANALCLIDLKTSKGVYPETHFPQLAGYELASTEMGFPATDGQFVLNTHPDGTYDFAASWATAEDFLAYLGALRAIRRIKANDPKEILEQERQKAILAALPSTSSELAQALPELNDMNAREVSYILSRLRKKGKVISTSGTWYLRPSGSSDPPSPGDRG